jgi:hypothetical protein
MPHGKHVQGAYSDTTHSGLGGWCQSRVIRTLISSNNHGTLDVLKACKVLEGETSSVGGWGSVVCYVLII